MQEHSADTVKPILLRADEAQSVIHNLAGSLTILNTVEQAVLRLNLKNPEMPHQT